LLWNLHLGYQQSLSPVLLRIIKDNKTMKAAGSLSFGIKQGDPNLTIEFTDAIKKFTPTGTDTISNSQDLCQ